MLLLAEGADPFLVDRRQLRTALHYAAAFGQATTLRALLSEGTLVHTAAGRVALRNAKVCDMSGICTCGHGSAETNIRRAV
jgi:ankyrin repeat protein